MFKKALLASAVALTLASPAHALVQVANFDWTTPFGIFNDIAYMGMTALGPSTVKQEVNASGNVFVGAQFSEFGAGFSTSYVNKSFVNQNFGTDIYFDFSGLSGYVSSIGSGGAFDFVFNPTGMVSVSYGTSKATATNWFTSPVVGINGSAGNSTGLKFKGTSEVLSIAIPGAGTFRDESDQPLDWFQNNLGLFFDVVTTNSVLSVGAAYDCDGAGSGTAQCKDLSVMSSGDITLYRVPEPTSLALIGLGLVGLGATRRRKSEQ